MGNPGLDASPPSVDQAAESRRIGAARFLAEFEPLYAWSVRHEGRFFVSALDETGPTEKASYRRQMRVLEGRFYKYEVADGGS